MKTAIHRGGWHDRQSRFEKRSPVDQLAGAW